MTNFADVPTVTDGQQHHEVDGATATYGLRPRVGRVKSSNKNAAGISQQTEEEPHQTQRMAASKSTVPVDVKPKHIKLRNPLPRKQASVISNRADKAADKALQRRHKTKAVPRTIAHAGQPPTRTTTTGLPFVVFADDKELHLEPKNPLHPANGAENLHLDDEMSAGVNHEAADHSSTADTSQKDGQAQSLDESVAAATSDTPNTSLPLSQGKVLFEKLVQIKIRHCLALAKSMPAVDLQSRSLLEVVQSEGNTLYDGFDLTWSIPTDRATPFPEAKKHVEDELRREHAEVDSFMTKPVNQQAVHEAMRLIDKETEENCWSQWQPCPVGEPEDIFEPGTELGAYSSPSWAEVRHTLTADQMVAMIATHRISFGMVLLPDYFWVDIFDLNHQGELVRVRKRIPPDVRYETMVQKLETWNQPYDIAHHGITYATREMVNETVQNGEAQQRERSQELLQRLDKVIEAAKEPNEWTYRLYTPKIDSHAAQDGLIAVSDWQAVKGVADFTKLVDSGRRGMLPVLMRDSRAQLYNLWFEVQQISKKVKVPRHEFEFTPEQLALLDGFIQSQTEEDEREGHELRAMFEGMW